MSQLASTNSYHTLRSKQETEMAPYNKQIGIIRWEVALQYCESSGTLAECWYVTKIGS
jgi:hypothetical protein